MSRWEQQKQQYHAVSPTAFFLTDATIKNHSNNETAQQKTTAIMTTMTMTRRDMASSSSTSSEPTMNDDTFISSSSTTTTNAQDNLTTTESSYDVDAALQKLFDESDTATNLSTASNDAWYNDTNSTLANIATNDIASAAAATTNIDWTPIWYNFADQSILVVKYVHMTTGMPYGWSIVSTTILLRLFLFPIMVQSQRTTSRMAHVQPELNLMKQRFEALGTPGRQEQIQFGQSMRQLFQRYEVSPLNALWAPVIQLPLFLGTFFCYC